MVCFMLEVLDQYMAITTTTKAACNEFAIPWALIGWYTSLFVLYNEAF
jgi:hypothetical protein